MNISDIYERNLFKELFKKIYNENTYNFSLNNNILNSIITNWKNQSNRFTKFSVLENIYDYNIILMDFRSKFIYIKNKRQFKMII